MIISLIFFINSRIKRCIFIRQVSGFTLVELLVAIMFTFLIITPLLGFMINVLDTDRKENAKATSEQEIQSALDFITRDLQQAVYIYDTNGLTKKSNTSTPSTSGIQDQIPPLAKADTCQDANKCQPILVFWKRKFLRDVIEIKGSNLTDENEKNDDTFVYSLVAYYIIKDDSDTWSKAARIARFEISDGVQDSNGDSCGSDYPNEKYVKKSNGTKLCPDSGFQRFNLSDTVGDLKDKMNSWRKASSEYDQKPLVLVDFIDQTVMGSTKPTCQSGTLVSGGFMGFYACIDNSNSKTTAQVFLRANALARVQSDNLNYSENNQTYFPTSSIRVEGRGYLFTK